MQLDLGGGGSGFELLYFDPMESVGLLLSRAVNHEEGRIFDHVPVSGLGDDAYWVEDLDGLYVRQGQYSLYISVTSESRDPKTAATAVARAALSRLPK